MEKLLLLIDSKKDKLFNIFCVSFFFSYIYFRKIWILYIFGVHLFSRMLYKRKFLVYLILWNRPKFVKFAKIIILKVKIIIIRTTVFGRRYMPMHSLLKIDAFFTNLYFKNSHQRKSRSRHLEVLRETDVLKNIAKLTGKQLCWSLSLIKFQAFRPATLLKKTSTQVLSCEYCKNFEHLSWKTSAKGYVCKWLLKNLIHSNKLTRFQKGSISKNN